MFFYLYEQTAIIIVATLVAGNGVRIIIRKFAFCQQDIIANVSASSDVETVVGREYRTAAFAEEAADAILSV